MFHNSRTLLHRLMNLAGGFTGYAGDYSAGAAQVIMSHVMGSIEVYEQQTAWPNVIEHAELVVLWGVNAQVTLKNSWNMPDHEGQAGFKALKEKGTRIISIDPVYNETAKLAGAEWIAPNAYTDVAMMLGWPTPSIASRSTIRPSSTATPPALTSSSPICSARKTASRRAPSGRAPSAASTPR